MTPKLLRREASGSKFLVPFADPHAGAPSSNLEKAKEDLDWAIENKAWVLLMGDMIENGTRNSVGNSVYEQRMSPQEQQDTVVELLRPAADKGLILGSFRGNHEERTMKESGIDINKNICDILKIPDLGYSAFLYLRVGEVTYIVYATHGSGMPTKKTSKLAMIMDLNRTISADIYLVAHGHERIFENDMERYVDLTAKTAKEHKRFYVMTGAYLGYADSYAEMKNYAPTEMGAVKLLLDGKEYGVTAQ